MYERNSMTFLSPIETEYGTAYLIGQMDNGNLLVSLPKSEIKRTGKQPENYRGGPSVIFEWSAK